MQKECSPSIGVHAWVMEIRVPTQKCEKDFSDFPCFISWHEHKYITQTIFGILQEILPKVWQDTYDIYGVHVYHWAFSSPVVACTLFLYDKEYTMYMAV